MERSSSCIVYILARIETNEVLRCHLLGAGYAACFVSESIEERRERERERRERKKERGEGRDRRLIRKIHISLRVQPWLQGPTSEKSRGTSHPAAVRDLLVSRSVYISVRPGLRFVIRPDGQVFQGPALPYCSVSPSAFLLSIVLS